MKFSCKRLAAPLARPWGLPALCYLAALLFWVVSGLVSLTGDTMARADGSLREQTLTVSDFTLSELQAGPDARQVVSTGGDPQMLLDNLGDRVVRTLSYTAEFDGTPREMCLYYTTAPDQPYSQDRRVFPEVTTGGTYVYTLPRGRICSLRLDPCSPDENKTVGITFDSLCLNRADTLPGGLDYLIPSWYQLFCLILLPSLAAAALDWVRACLRRVR